MSKTNSYQKTLFLTQISILSALIILMTMVPFLGYISYGWLSITIIHIPVIIGAVVLGPRAGLLLGLIWGVTCVVKAFLAPPSPLEGIIFTNPVVSILPRLLSGWVAGLVYAAFKKKGAGSRLAGTGLAAALGSVTNTVFVMGLIYVFFGTALGSELGIQSVNISGLIQYILLAFSINAWLEALLAILITIPISRVLLKRFSSSRKEV